MKKLGLVIFFLIVVVALAHKPRPQPHLSVLHKITLMNEYDETVATVTVTVDPNYYFEVRSARPDPVWKGE